MFIRSDCDTVCLYAVHQNHPHVLSITAACFCSKAATWHHILLHYEIPVTSPNQTQMEPCKHTHAVKVWEWGACTHMQDCTHTHVIKFSDRKRKPHWKQCSIVWVRCDTWGDVFQSKHLTVGDLTPHVMIHKADLEFCSMIERVQARLRFVGKSFTVTLNQKLKN